MISIILAIAVLVLGVCSSLKHILFQSTAWDLGIFDQAVYLIGTDQSPISSFTNFHILGDHSALILYPLSLLYRIYPSVYWLLTVQAIALALPIVPLYRIGLILQLEQPRSLIWIYLFYPLIFNLNLFDFHPEVIALPGFFFALWLSLEALTIKRLVFICLAIILILSCKAVLALTVIAMGIWWILGQRRHIYGSIAIAMGIAWFLIATQVLIPQIGGESAAVTRHLTRYAYLGNSFQEIGLNIFLRPDLSLARLFSIGSLEYIALLFSPLMWRISPTHLSPLTAAIPTLAMNFLSTDGAQRDLIHQYSLPIVPFLMMSIAYGLSANYGWQRLRSPKAIIAWALLGFLLLSRIHFFAGRYWQALDTWQANQTAISKIDELDRHHNQKGSVLTTAQIAPHLTHRPVVKLAITDIAKNQAQNPLPDYLQQFTYVLLSLRHPGWLSDRQFSLSLIEDLQKDPTFRLDYRQDEVYLFRKIL